jgi:CheY-like chemotaxis protein
MAAGWNPVGFADRIIAAIRNSRSFDFGGPAMTEERFSATGRGSTLMLVDDDPDDLWIFGHLLQRACPWPDRFALVKAVDGVQALARIEAAVAAKSPLPDLILLDMNMPGLSGLDVLRMMRASAALADTPILILSTASNREAADEALRHGADAVITKPDSMHSIAELASTIFRTWLGSRPPLRDPHRASA